jgi:hypothetical protein
LNVNVFERVVVFVPRSEEPFQTVPFMRT